MFPWMKKKKIDNIEIKIAGMKSKIAIYSEILNRGGTLDWSHFDDYIDLAKKVCQLEVLLFKLKE
jgi:hypothetical protein